MQILPEGNLLEPRSAAVPSSFRPGGRRSIGALSLRHAFRSTGACRVRRLPFQANLSEGSFLFAEFFPF